MTDHPRNSCHHPSDNPAAQPHQPTDAASCGEPSATTWPDLCEPIPYHTPNPCCRCPTKIGSSTPNCLEELIAKQDVDIRAAAKAEAFKKVLEAMLKAANDAGAKYTQEKYKELVEEWVRQDALIVEVLRTLDCKLDCWPCILDCHVCPLLNDLYYAEKKLRDDDHLIDNVLDLYDKQYWLTRYAAVKRRDFDRITLFMKARENPADTIGKALIANKGLIEAAGKAIGTEPGKAIYDVFLRLVPLHLAIAPPSGPNTQTNIDKRYTEFCECSTSKPDDCSKPSKCDDCCGPNVGELSMRQRLIGPQPYLIDPNDYMKLNCCLVTKQWEPAKNYLSDAEIKLAGVGDEIARYEAKLKEGWIKTFEAAAMGAIPSVINCCDYTK